LYSVSIASFDERLRRANWVAIIAKAVNRVCRSQAAGADDFDLQMEIACVR
jgi:hypothetical protein